METYGVISGRKNCFSIYVAKDNGYDWPTFLPEISYQGYSKANAIKDYRRRFKLVNKKIEFYDWSK